MRTLHVLQDSSRAAVYVLQRFDRLRFKVGWALEPMQRINQLPECGANHLDLEHSMAPWLPSRKRAQQIERAVHQNLAPYVAEAVHSDHGYSERFEPIAHPMAVRMLAQMPMGQRTHLRTRLAPFNTEAPPSDDVRMEAGPQDTWWALEDLWSRLAVCCPVTVECDGETHRVIVVGFRHAWDGPVGALRTAVMDTCTYRWDAAGTHNEFVKLIDYRGDDLVCTLATLRLIESWPHGQDLVWQVKGFLLRLERMPCSACP